MIIVLPLLYNRENESLRYSLRSFEKNFVGADELHVYTNNKELLPRWLSADKVYTVRNSPNGYSKEKSVNSKLAKAFSKSSKDSLLINDDFFCLIETDSIPLVHRDEDFFDYTVNRRLNNSDSYSSSMVDTYSELDSLQAGFKNFETALPMIIKNGSAARKASSIVNKSAHALQWRSIYGNLSSEESVALTDFDSSGFASYNGDDFIRAKQKFASMFSKPSKWERS